VTAQRFRHPMSPMYESPAAMRGSSLPVAVLLSGFAHDFVVAWFQTRMILIAVACAAASIRQRMGCAACVLKSGKRGFSRENSMSHAIQQRAVRQSFPGLSCTHEFFFAVQRALR